MNLQEKHLQEIPTAWDRGKLIVIPTDIREELSQASTAITKDYMKRFLEWIIVSGWIYDDYFKFWIKGEQVCSFDELIEIFLNNENQQP